MIVIFVGIFCGVLHSEWLDIFKTSSNDLNVGGRVNINMSYQYRDSHYKNKTVVRLSYLYRKYKDYVYGRC